MQEGEDEGSTPSLWLRTATVSSVALLCLLFVYVALPILWLHPLRKLGELGVMSEGGIDHFTRPLRQLYMQSSGYRRYIDAQQAALDRFGP